MESISAYLVAGATILGTPVAVWVTVAIVGWAAAIFLAYVAGRDRPPLASAERQVTGVPQILRWLLLETDAEEAVYLEVVPGGDERVWVEPRGLDSRAVAGLVGRARDALMRPGDPGPDEGVVRWLGTGGSKCIVLSESDPSAAEPLRFARYLLELEQRLPDEAWSRLERKLRRIEGVAWAEETEEVVRVLLAEGASTEETRSAVESRLPAGTRVEWVEPVSAPPAEAPRRAPAELSAGISTGEALEARIELAEVVMNENGRATADVRVLWKQQELRGRGHGKLSPAGRYFAAAHAVADALRPLLDTEIVVEGIYSASTQERVPVLIASVRLEGEQFVGAVVEPPGEPGWAGARAVLDAVNRRLTQIAGRSGRI